MNIMESLSREIARVASLKTRYEGLRGLPGTNVEPAISIMEASLEVACVAIGEGEPKMILMNIENLKAFEE